MTSIDPKRDAQLWEQGCLGDGCRNNFVIPEIAKILNTERPSTVIDVGAGTGYVARRLSALIENQPKWTLVDVSRERLALAEKLRPKNMLQQTICADVIAMSLRSATYGAALLTFTILEIPDTVTIAAALWSILSEGGVLLIAVPDSWEDVLAEFHRNPSLALDYLKGRVSLSKVDKFTEEPYPFEAVRNEVLIQCFLSLGFHLCRIVRSDVHSAYILTFRRCFTGGNHAIPR